MHAKEWRAALLERIHLTGEIYLLRLKFQSGFDFLPGQYIAFRLVKDGRAIYRAYTICSPRHLAGEHVDVCIRRITEPVRGFASNLLAEIPIGTMLDVRGPLGRFTLERAEEPDLVLVATGTGITPFMSMLGTLFHEGVGDREIWLFFGVRYENAILFDEELNAWAERYPLFHYIPTISRPSEQWKGERGYVQALFKKHITDPRGKELYLCGLTKMIEEMESLALGIGFEKGRIHHEVHYRANR